MAMTTDEAIKHFGSQQALADALGIKQPSVAGWGGYPPPYRQLQIQIMTAGKLIAEADCLTRVHQIKAA